MNNISVYTYLDYRQFLKDIFNNKKKENPIFSYRVFSRKSGLRSSAFLKLVIDGARNLTMESIYKIAKGFSLSKDESEFFENLVFMNQAKTNEEKNHYYHKLSKTSGYLEIKKIENDFYEYYSHWYHPAIRELISFKKGMMTEEEISKKLFPLVTVKEVRKSIKLLLDLGLIVKDASGYKQKDVHLSTAKEVQSIMIKNYHSQMINLALESLDTQPPERRDITSVTMSVNAEKIQLLKDKIFNFRNDLLNESDKPEDANTVIQINFQLFSLTQK